MSTGASETRRVRGNSAMQATEERARVVRRSSFDSCRGIAPDALKQSGVSLTSWLSGGHLR